MCVYTYDSVCVRVCTLMCVREESGFGTKGSAQFKRGEPPPKGSANERDENPEIEKGKPYV